MLPFQRSSQNWLKYCINIILWYLLTVIKLLITTPNKWLQVLRIIIFGVPHEIVYSSI